LQVSSNVGLVYFDLDVDLHTPQTTTDGALDWMGVRHMLGVDGAARDLKELGPRSPLLPPPAPCVPTTLEPPTTAHGVNDRGDIIGRCYDASGKELGWLLRYDGSLAILDDPSFLTADGWAIDNSRVVVGDYSDADGFVHGFTWTEVGGFTTLDFKNNMTGLRAINQRGDISGIYFDGLTLHGFLRLKNGTEVTIDPPGSVETDTAAVNNSGTIAGFYYDADFNAHGYIATAAGRRD